MEPGLKRTTIARIAAAVGMLCGAIGLLTSYTRTVMFMGPKGFGTGAVILLLVALFVLVDGAVSFEKSRVMPGSKS